MASANPYLVLLSNILYLHLRIIIINEMVQINYSVVDCYADCDNAAI